MTQEMLPTPKLKESWERFAATRSKVQALRYGNLSRVLVNLDEHHRVPTKPNRNRNADGSQAEIVELREHVATLKAEYERLIDRVTDDLEGLGIGLPNSNQERGSRGGNGRWAIPATNRDISGGKPWTG
jgi:hypothetical protein